MNGHSTLPVSPVKDALANAWDDYLEGLCFWSTPLIVMCAVLIMRQEKMITTWLFWVIIVVSALLACYYLLKKVCMFFIDMYSAEEDFV